MHVYKKNTLALALLFLIVGLTFLRENLFLEINAILNHQEYNNAYFYFLYDFFKGLKAIELLFLKWGLTILFILLISFLTILIIHNWFKQQVFTKATIVIYLFIYLGLLLLVLFSKWLGFYENIFIFFRKIIGLLTSPIPLFFLFSVLYYKQKSTK